jgi:Fe-S cluster assembly protein SufD
MIDTLQSSPASARVARGDTLSVALDAMGAGDFSASPAWLKALREQARALLPSIGFPTTREEEWRFTNIAPLLQLPLRAAAQNSRAVTSGDVEPFRLANTDCLVFVDGWFREDLSLLPDSGAFARELEQPRSASASRPPCLCQI